MRNISIIMLITLAFDTHGQVKNLEWANSIITMNDGAKIESMIALNNDFYEGLLIVNDKEKYLAIPPIKILSFSIISPTGDSIKFKSINTHFLKRSGEKRSILKELFVGSKYSIYSKHVPDKKTQASILPYGGGVAYGVFQYLESEEVLFLCTNNTAYQISLPFKEERYGKKFKIQKHALIEVMGSDYELLKREIKLKNLNINKLENLFELIGSINSMN